MQITSASVPVFAHRPQSADGTPPPVAEEPKDLATTIKDIKNDLVTGVKKFVADYSDRPGYTGPEDGRTTVPALRHARALLDLLQPPGAPLPDRRSRLRDRLIEIEHTLRERFGPPRRPLESLLAPSFRLLDHRPQLGTLLQRVLAVAEPLLDPEDDRDAAFLSLLCHYEEQLTAAGAIASEYACFAAVRSEGPA